jgi:hypothetical protein
MNLIWTPLPVCLQGVRDQIRDSVKKDVLIPNP